MRSLHRGSAEGSVGLMPTTDITIRVTEGSELVLNAVFER